MIQLFRNSPIGTPLHEGWDRLNRKKSDPRLSAQQKCCCRKVGEKEMLQRSWRKRNFELSRLRIPKRQESSAAPFGHRSHLESEDAKVLLPPLDCSHQIRDEGCFPSQSTDTSKEKNVVGSRSRFGKLTRRWHEFSLETIRGFGAWLHKKLLRNWSIQRTFTVLYMMNLSYIYFFQVVLFISSVKTNAFLTDSLKSLTAARARQSEKLTVARMRHNRGGGGLP
jgi:hypothetical protein